MQKLLVSITLLAILFLSLVGGAVVAYFELIPGFFALRTSGESVAEQVTVPRAQVPLGVNHPALTSNMPVITPDLLDGVIRYDPARAWNGYTLIMPSSYTEPVRLIDMAGETLHQWSIPDNLPLPADPKSGAGDPDDVSQPSVYAQFAENGDLIFAASSDEPEYEGGIARINRTAELLWHYPGPVRNDFAVTPDGGVYAVLRSERKEPWPGLERIATPFYDDVLVQLDSNGEEIRKVSILEAIQNSAFIHLLQYADPDRHAGDLLGVSSLSVLDAEHAALLPDANAGDVLLSLRQLDVIAVMDPDVPVMKWAARGEWHLQGDVDVLENGNILLFDSHGDLSRGGSSRVLEIDPVTLGREWVFPGNVNEQLLSSFGGTHQRLPNGNTLISDASLGRFIEVTPAGMVVWEYRMPQKAPIGSRSHARRAPAAKRFQADELTFLIGSDGSSR